MQSSIRPPRQDERPQVRTLQSLLPEPAPALLAAAMEDGIGRIDSAAGTESPDTVAVGDAVVVRVSVAEARPVGYVLAVSGTETHLAELVVAPEYRRAGRGRALVEWVIDSLPEPVTVHVAVDNPARELYSAVGFQEMERTTEQFDAAIGVTMQYGEL